MVQQGQTIELTRHGAGGERLWAYRYRTAGRGSKRVQHGGFASEQDARDALERELERLRRERRIPRRLTLAELVETYLEQHDVQPVTIEKLRYLLTKATALFGERRLGELTSQEIAEWRMTLSPGYRSTTSVPTDGGPHRRPSASRRFGGSTISGTPSRPLRSVPASQPSTSPATWAPA
jgi:antitoxin (DNA-binding transcriptional repressor) of toxin-antitoxin stability system